MQDSACVTSWRDFVESELRPIVDYCEQNTISKKLFQTAGRNHLLYLPDDRRTLQHSHSMISTLMSAGSQSLAMFLSAYKVVASLLRDHGNQNIKDAFVSKILSGQYIIPLGITEPNAGSSLKHLATQAIDHGDYFLINGCKQFICSMNIANYLLTLVNTATSDSPEYSLILVPVNTKGVSVKKLTLMGWRAVHVSEVTLSDVKVAKQNLIGEPGKALSYLGKALSIERFHLSLLALESAKLSFQHAVHFAKNRIIKDNALIKKQVIAHKLSKIKTELFTMQSTLEQFIATMDVSSKNFPTIVAQLKYYFTTQAEKITSTVLQLHGAHGCLSHSSVERQYQDCKILCIGGGTSEVMLEMISRSL